MLARVQPARAAKTYPGVSVPGAVPSRTDKLRIEDNASLNEGEAQTRLALLGNQAVAVQAEIASHNRQIARAKTNKQAKRAVSAKKYQALRKAHGPATQIYGAGLRSPHISAAAAVSKARDDLVRAEFIVPESATGVLAGRIDEFEQAAAKKRRELAKRQLTLASASAEASRPRKVPAPKAAAARSSAASSAPKAASKKKPARDRAQEVAEAFLGDFARKYRYGVGFGGNWNQLREIVKKGFKDLGSPAAIFPNTEAHRWFRHSEPQWEHFKLTAEQAPLKLAQYKAQGYTENFC